MKNCILQLMLEENNKAVVVAGGSTDDALTDAMREQNNIMKRQLRLQRIENTQKAMKSFQYMMDNLDKPLPYDEDDLENQTLSTFMRQGYWDCGSLESKSTGELLRERLVDEGIVMLTTDLSE